MSEKGFQIPASGEWPFGLVDRGRLVDWLERVEASRFLSRLLQRDAAVFEEALSDPAAALRALLTPDPAWESQSSVEVACALRRRKRHLMLLLASLDYGAISTTTYSLMECTGYLSDFAALAIEAGLRCLMREQGFSDTTGIVIFGMGKLGGHELNYSSDVDLIVLFDSSGLQHDDSGNHRRIQRVIRHLVVFLETTDAEGYIFRSDLRLRPDPSSMPLAVEIETAVHYYESMGLAWERAVMLKARPIAGDFALGEVFLHRISPFIWRRNLDYASIDDIQAIRARALQSSSGDGVEGVNVKLIEGGIREIELYAQSLQLIWGGRNPRLRVRPTLEALARLAEAAMIAPDVPECLGSAYRFYRRLEHGAQLLEDQQCHSLPNSSEGWESFSRLFGASPTQIQEQFFVHLQEVRAICQPRQSESVRAVVESGGDDSQLAQLGFHDVVGAEAIVERWVGGGYRVSASERARRLLQNLLPKLLRAFAATAAPDDALRRMDRFLEALPAGVQLFSLFAATPRLLRHCADIMGNAPRMADWLARKPRLLEYLLHDTEEPSLAQLVALQSLEETLEDCRRLAHEVEFRTSVGFMSGTVSLEELFRQHSQTVEVVVAQTLRALRAESPKLPGQGFAILALGKLGKRQLAPDSDLDFLFVSAPGNDGNAPYLRLAQRLINGLSVATAEGGLYEVDLRLRPHGASGPLCSQLATLQHYYAREAWRWEFFALSQARILYADSDIADALRTWLHGVQTRSHEAEDLRAAVREMQARINMSFPAQGLWDVKHSRGGLVDASFCLQFLQMMLVPQQPDFIGASPARLLEAGAAVGLFEPGAYDDVAEAIHLMTLLQTGVRVSGGHAMLRLENAPQGQRKLLCRLAEVVDFPDLEETLRQSYAVVSALSARLFGDYDS